MMRRLTLILFLSVFVGIGSLWAQTKTITGTVTDSEDGQPIPGVSIIVKGTTIGTITDANGKYSLATPQDATDLIYSFVGMETMDVPIQGRSVINVAMKSSAIGLDEVVVTSLGISREKKALGYSVQEVDGSSLEKAGTDDVAKALAGKTAGVNVISSSGSAGAATYITIRGAASLTGNNQPLFIVDGQPIASTGGSSGVAGVQTSSRSIDLNPSDIESMTVLKGGAATALYGVRAANGVIMITTKSGKKNQKTRVNVSSTFGINQVSKLPDVQTTFAQGSGGNWYSGHYASWGPKISESAYSKNPSVWAYPEFDVDGALVPKDSPLADSGPAKVYDKYAFFQNGNVYDNNINITSGNERTSYYFSVGNRTETGVVPNNKFARTSLRLNAKSDLSAKWKTGANVNYVFSKGNFIQKGSNTSGVMLGLLRTPPSFNNAAGYEFEDGTQRSYRHGGGYDNPYWTANKNYYDETINRLIGSAYLEFDATDWMTLTYNVGLDAYTRYYTNFLAVGSNTNKKGSIYESANRSNIFNGDFIARFNKELNNIQLNLNVGNNMRRNFYEYVDGYSDGGLIIPDFEHVSNTASQKVSQSVSEVRTAAFYGEFTGSYKSILYVGATARYEWSTTMPEDNIAAFYPSVNMGFVFTELPFLKDNSILTFGKIRGSYAKTANIAGAYATVTNYYTGGVGDGWTNGFGFPAFGSSAFTYGNTLFSSNLSHENMKSYEAGAELHFLNNRISVDGSYFYNENTDLLLSVPIARSTGYSSKYTNAASMTSKGFEISLIATPVKTRNFSWDILANFTKIKTVVDELAPGIENVFLSGFTDPQIRAVAGMDYRTIFGYDWYRDDNGNVIINNDPNDGYRDGYPMTNEQQGMVPLGTVNPDWTANITNTLSFKGLVFSFLFDFKHGGNMYNGTRYAMNFFGVSAETVHREVTYNPDGSIDFANTPAENIVVMDGVLGHINSDGDVVTDGTTNNVPVVLDQSWYQGYGSNFGGGATSAAVEDASWIRLREINLSYDLKTLMPNVVWLSSLQVFATGNNLWLSTPYRGIDPETSLVGAANGQGMDYFNMPGKKSYQFGFRIGF
jgi:TonB-linked SusC/RagA family outer membrane protein